MTVMAATEPKVVDDQWRIPDELWARIEPLLPPKRPQPKGGRPWASDRQMMDAIFYVLRTGIQWKALPNSMGSGSTAHRRFQQWEQAGVFLKLWAAGLEEYDQLKGLDWEWQAMDGAMTKAPLGGKMYRSQPYRPGEEGGQALCTDGRARRADCCGGGRR